MNTSFEWRGMYPFVVIDSTYCFIDEIDWTVDRDIQQLSQRPVRVGNTSISGEGTFYGLERTDALYSNGMDALSMTVYFPERTISFDGVLLVVSDFEPYGDTTQCYTEWQAENVSMEEIGLEKRINHPNRKF